MMGDGTYKFHAEGGRATPPHEGTITAANGRWTLHTLKGLSKDYSDGGSYEIHDTIAVITGKHHGWAKDRTDPHTRAEALRIAQEEPPAGLSPEAAAAVIRETLASVGDTCPEC
jgi:hypothetical protein